MRMYDDDCHFALHAFVDALLCVVFSQENDAPYANAGDFDVYPSSPYILIIVVIIIFVHNSSYSDDHDDDDDDDDDE